MDDLEEMIDGLDGEIEELMARMRHHQRIADSANDDCGSGQLRSPDEDWFDSLVRIVNNSGETDATSCGGAGGPAIKHNLQRDVALNEVFTLETERRDLEAQLAATDSCD